MVVSGRVSDARLSQEAANAGATPNCGRWARGPQRLTAWKRKARVMGRQRAAGTIFLLLHEDGELGCYAPNPLVPWRRFTCAVRRIDRYAAMVSPAWASPPRHGRRGSGPRFRSQRCEATTLYPATAVAKLLRRGRQQASSVSAQSQDGQNRMFSQQSFSRVTTATLT